MLKLLEGGGQKATSSRNLLQSGDRGDRFGRSLTGGGPLNYAQKKKVVVGGICFKKIPSRGFRREFDVERIALRFA